MFQQYCNTRFFKGLMWISVCVLSVLVIAARHHYTVDVVIAWYTVPMVWYLYLYHYPDPLPGSGFPDSIKPEDPKDKDSI
eukprot:TRINITY_DN11908_c0_g1_i1.p1 TRINITY_DN11908_c0_g1~~TRINITY_DN11908_c0_g1_i1.p1  ORF type:complete len:80 (+),score=5.98 TRINITY_DN11908_c0_g1_i1:130-369(+)